MDNRGYKSLIMSTLSEKGFTAVELLIVIVVVAILAVLAAPKLTGIANKNKVAATTNELIGLIEFARATAKSTGQAVVVSECGDTDDCGLKVSLFKNKDNTSVSPLRVMHKQDLKNVTYGNDKKYLAFYPDGTRGLHITQPVVKVFNDNGSSTGATEDFSGLQNTGDVKWQVKVDSAYSNESYCRVITITALGSTKVSTQGCSK